MQAEHCEKYGAEIPFCTPNYKIKTWPKLEWSITVNQAECPPENKLHGRVIRPIDDCMEAELVRLAKLIREEVIALVLYTGPMVSSSITYSALCFPGNQLLYLIPFVFLWTV
jgi:hypothetical protein